MGGGGKKFLELLTIHYNDINRDKLVILKQTNTINILIDIIQFYVWSTVCTA